MLFLIYLFLFIRFPCLTIRFFCYYKACSFEYICTKFTSSKLDSFQLPYYPNKLDPTCGEGIIKFMLLFRGSPKVTSGDVNIKLFLFLFF
jgi:hypothetical protein